MSLSHVQKLIVAPQTGIRGAGRRVDQEFELVCCGRTTSSPQRSKAAMRDPDSACST